MEMKARALAGDFRPIGSLKWKSGLEASALQSRRLCGLAGPCDSLRVSQRCPLGQGTAAQSCGEDCRDEGGKETAESVPAKAVFTGQLQAGVGRAAEGQMSRRLGLLAQGEGTWSLAQHNPEGAAHLGPVGCCHEHCHEHCRARNQSRITRLPGQPAGKSKLEAPPCTS